MSGLTWFTSCRRIEKRSLELCSRLRPCRLSLLITAFRTRGDLSLITNRDNNLLQRELPGRLRLDDFSSLRNVQFRALFQLAQQ